MMYSLVYVSLVKFSLIYFSLAKIIVCSLNYVSLVRFDLIYANSIKIMLFNLMYVSLAKFTLSQLWKTKNWLQFSSPKLHVIPHDSCPYQMPKMVKGTSMHKNLLAASEVWYPAF
jgi:hypothetical protein